MPRAREKLVLAKGPTPKIIPQSDVLPKIYLSHTVVHSTELEEEFLACSGTRYRCFSFVYILPEAIYWSPKAWAAYLVNVAHGNSIMMDSGAFSYQMFLERRAKRHSDSEEELSKLREQTVEQYVTFCKQRSKEWDFYVTFDYAPKVDVVWKQTKLLEGRGLRPVPIYHGDAPVDWLKKYLDGGYKRIGISPGIGRRMTYREARYFLDSVFKTVEPYKVKLHGFAVTSLSLMFAYPWYSVDSSSWSRTASYGCIYVPDKGSASMRNVHVSLTGGLKDASNSATTLTPQALQSVKSYVEGLGWDFELLRKSLAYRFQYCGWIMAHLTDWKECFTERYIKWKTLL